LQLFSTTNVLHTNGKFDATVCTEFLLETQQKNIIKKPPIKLSGKSGVAFAGWEFFRNIVYLHN